MSDRDPGEGFFDHLDDASAPSPGRDVLDSVVHRGRQLRTRRQIAWTTSAMAGITAVVIGGLGISHAIRADGTSDGIEPAQTSSPSVTATASPSHHKKHGGNGGQAVGPGATLQPGAQPSATISVTPSTAPSPGGTCAPEATPTSGTVVDPSLPPLAPPPSPTCAPVESPSPTPSETASPEPTDSTEPTTSPS
jgi:hypothetical protein